MKREKILKIICWSTVALIIPILGQMFVPGWNWDALDFVFAWTFFNIFGLTYTFVTNAMSHRKSKVVAGIVTVAVFVFIWVMLATG